MWHIIMHRLTVLLFLEMGVMWVWSGCGLAGVSHVTPLFNFLRLPMVCVPMTISYINVGKKFNASTSPSFSANLPHFFLLYLPHQ